MICSSCGKEIRDGAEDCPYCGRPTTKEGKGLFKFIIGGSIAFYGCLAILAILTCIVSLVFCVILMIDIL